MHPDDRAVWLHSLPNRLDRCRKLWRLEIGAHIPSFLSQVFTCTDAAGNDLILKLAPPLVPAAAEAAALGAWNGRHAVRLRGWDEKAGALLLDRLVPATPLPPGHDEDATPIAAAILAALHAAPISAHHPIPSQAEAFDRYLRMTRLNAEPDAAGLPLLDTTRPLAARLWATTPPVLLHGDFIDKNILLGPAGYVAIDPIPLLGDPCSDIGFYAANHPPARHIADRARVLARLLQRDPERAARWAAIYAVGQACETWREDSDELQTWVRSAEAASLLAG